MSNTVIVLLVSNHLPSFIGFPSSKDTSKLSGLRTQTRADVVDMFLNWLKGIFPK